MPAPIDPLYTATATVQGGRAGHARSSDGVLKLTLTMPRELGGDGAVGTNPEQLFAAGYAACFESALRLVARQQGKNVSDGTVTASVTIGKTPEGGYGLSVRLLGRLPMLSREEAEGLMHAAHQVCPYSHATRGNIDVVLSVET